MKSNYSAPRLLGFRLDPDNPRKITPQEVSEEVYFAIGRPIWRHQKKMQAQGKCALPGIRQLWKCDSDCELCEFQRLGQGCRLDLEIEDPDGDTCRVIDKLADNAPSPETVVMNQIMQGQLLDRLSELCPEAVQAGRSMVDDDLSARKALEQLGINRSAYRYRVDCAEKQLCKEFGVDDIRELLDDLAALY